MPLAVCPNCGCDRFDGEAIRADAVDPVDPGAYGEVDGDWFNLCLGCGDWSLNRRGAQEAVKNPKARPVKGSMPPVKRNGDSRI